MRDELSAWVGRVAPQWKECTLALKPISQLEPGLLSPTYCVAWGESPPEPECPSVKSRDSLDSGPRVVEDESEEPIAQ